MRSKLLSDFLVGITFYDIDLAPRVLRSQCPKRGAVPAILFDEYDPIESRLYLNGYAC